MAGIASAATAVVIAHVAGGTKTIRVGAGGIMLPNHAPLVIAEQFGTLEALYPGRIDLGLGRAPGTDQLTIQRAAPRPDERRHVPAGRAELQRYLADRAAGPACRRCRAPARTCRSGSSARACSARSSRRRSACPTRSRRTSRRTRCCRRSRSTARRFEPSEQLAAAVRDGRRERDRRRRRRERAPAVHLAAAGVRELLRGRRGQLPPPIDDIETYWTPAEKERASAMLAARSSARRRPSARGSRRSSRRRAPTSSSSPARSTIMRRGCAPTSCWLG